jgi:hypothetical protein
VGVVQVSGPDGGQPRSAAPTFPETILDYDGTSRDTSSIDDGPKFGRVVALTMDSTCNRVDVDGSQAVRMPNGRVAVRPRTIQQFETPGNVKSACLVDVSFTACRAVDVLCRLELARLHAFF